MRLKHTFKPFFTPIKYFYSGISTFRSFIEIIKPEILARKKIHLHFINTPFNYKIYCKLVRFAVFYLNSKIKSFKNQFYKI